MQVVSRALRGAKQTFAEPHADLPSGAVAEARLHQQIDCALRDVSRALFRHQNNFALTAGAHIFFQTNRESEGCLLGGLNDERRLGAAGERRHYRQGIRSVVGEDQGLRHIGADGFVWALIDMVRASYR